MQILVQTYKRVNRSRATIYTKPGRIIWEAGRVYSYALPVRSCEFLRLWHADVLMHQQQEHQPDLWEDHRRLA